MEDEEHAELNGDAVWTREEETGKAIEAVDTSAEPDEQPGEAAVTNDAAPEAETVSCQ